MSLITIIGRGHGGTRAMSHTLSASNVYMGEPLNQSGDLLPPQAMYEACRIMARHVRWLGGLQWDFSALHSMPIPHEFTALIERYLTTVLNSPAEHRGWKIPETTLVFPWIVRMFPEIKYIHWVRNPRDNILARHLTDDLADFGIEYPPSDDERLRRAISWQYQYEIVKATPKPQHWMRVRFEDFVLQQDATLAHLEAYLGIPLARIPVRAETVGRYSADDGVSYYDFLAPGMQEYGYAIPSVGASAIGQASFTLPTTQPQSGGEKTIMAESQTKTSKSARRTRSAGRKPNIVLMAIDSISASHMSSYGYPRLTTPHLDHFATQGALFENTFSAHVPTTSAYSSMLTGRDVFGTQVVALRHKGPLRPEVKTLPEVLREAGYDTTCVGFSGNPASRGFDRYLNFANWGSWNEGRSPKAQNLNEVAIPELNRLVKQKQPFFLFLRHMDPHSPYLPPAPYERMFYHGNETDKRNKSMEPVMSFKPFRDYFASWMPPGITDKAYIDAQYDGAVAYMDACIQTIFNALETHGILDETIVVINGDHGETLYEHECWYDHHGMYDNVLHVPLIIRYPGKVPAGKRVKGYNQHKDLMPTILELAEIEPQGVEFDGRSLLPMVRGEVTSHESEIYITECTWMRKHGWRTPQWKLMVALEPDFHFKPPVELYDLIADPEENNNIADSNPDLVATLRGRMEAWIAKRTQETGLPNPIENQGDWHGHEGVGAFKTSQQAYDTMHIGDPAQAARLQAKSRD